MRPMDETGEVGIGRVQADATLRGLTLEVVSRPPVDSLTEAAELLGIRPTDIVKTLVVRRRVPRNKPAEGAPGAYLFALVPGDRQISWPKLRELLGINRISLADSAQAHEATGYERGTITPLGSTAALPVYADSRVTGRISIGAGEHGYSAFVDADRLLGSLEATVADITEPLQQH